MEQFPDTKVFILAAGFGKRLKPLTETQPKALIKIGKQPILRIVVEKFLKLGFSQTDIAVNTHSFADQIHHFLHHYYPQVQISHEPKIRGTGGALFAASKYLKDYHVIIHNADIICEENLLSFLRTAAEKNTIATMMLKNPEAGSQNGQIVMNEKGNVIDIAHQLKKGQIGTMDFTGIHYLNRKIWDYAKECDFCSIWQAFYLPSMRCGEVVGSYITNAYWNDIGSPDQLLEAQKKYQNGFEE